MRRRVSAGAVDLHAHRDEKRLFRVERLVLPPLLAAKVTKYIPSASWEAVITANPVVMGTFFLVTAYIL